MLIYFAIPAVVLVTSAFCGGIIYGMWKWDTCCEMPFDEAEGTVYFCLHGKAYKLGGLKRWARPAWLRVTQDTAFRILISRVEAEADQILVGTISGG